MMWKPPLTVQLLERAGFKKVSAWIAVEGRLALETSLSEAPGVYAFVVDGLAVYVGLAASGLSNRCKFYARPGASQRTSIRLHAAMLQILTSDRKRIDIYTAHPEDSIWNGLPVSTLFGLEAGMIKAYDLPWNLRGV